MAWHGPARYTGRCSGCSGSYGIGDEITGIPPANGRRRWIIFHRACSRAHAAQRHRPEPDPVARNRDWLTDEEAQMVASAWAKRSAPMVRDRQPFRDTAETLEMERRAMERVLDPAA